MALEQKIPEKVEPSKVSPEEYDCFLGEEICLYVNHNASFKCFFCIMGDCPHYTDGLKT